jgi:hypothetical protein
MKGLKGLSKTRKRRVTLPLPSLPEQGLWSLLMEPGGAIVGGLQLKVFMARTVEFSRFLIFDSINGGCLIIHFEG